MDAALLGYVAFPPPTTRSEILPLLRRPRAGGTADAGIAPLVQPVGGHVVGVDIVPELFRGPITQSVELRQLTMFGVEFDLVDRGPADSLMPPQPCDPGLQP